MNRTFKTTASIGILLLAAVLLLAPWRIGATIRPLVSDTIQTRLPAETEERVHIEELDYQQGFFTSSARYRVSTQLSDATQLPAFEFRAEIAHGPVLIGADGISLGAARMKLYPLSEPDGSNDEVELELRVGFDETLVLHLDVDSLALDDGSNQFGLTGVAGRFALNPDQSADFTLDIQNLSLLAPEAQLDLLVENIHLSGQDQQINNLAAPGNVQLSVSGIANRGATEFTIANISAQTELVITPEAADRIDLKQLISLSGLQSAWPLEALEWDFRIRRIPTEVVQDYFVMAAQMQDRIDAGQPVDAALMQSGFLLAIRLLNTDFNLHNSASARAYGGMHESTLDIDYDGIPTLTDITHLDLNELIAALNVELILDFDLDAILQSPAASLVDPYVQEGYIILNNGQVQLQSSLRNSELTLNGATVSWQQFFE